MSDFKAKNKNENFVTRYIKDAELALTHTLLLDLADVNYDVDSRPKKDPLSERIGGWLSVCFDATSQACRETCNSMFSFFDRNSTLIDSKLSDKDFSFLDGPTFLNLALKEEAFLSAYDKTRKLISVMYPVNSQDITQILLPFGKDKIITGDDNNRKLTQKRNDIYGLHFLSSNYSSQWDKKPLISFDDNNLYSHTSKLLSEVKNDDMVQFEDSIKKVINTMATSLRASGKNTITALKENFTPKGLSSIDTTKEYDMLQLCNLELLQALRFHPESSTGPLGWLGKIKKSSNITEGSLKNYMASFAGIKNKIQAADNAFSDSDNPSDTWYMTEADKLYCLYRLEKMLPFDTINCMSSCIESSDHKDFLLNYIDYISAICSMPNAFSRSIFLQMAVDNLNYNYNQIPDLTSIDTRVVALKTEKTIDTFSHDIYWLQNYTKMIKVLSKYVFPVYCNHFFSTMWRSARATVKTDQECLIFLFNTLSTYFSDKNCVDNLLLSEILVDKKKEPILYKEYNQDHLITPEKAQNIVNKDIFQKCFSSVLSSAGSHYPAPDFISRDYFKNLGNRTPKNLQNMFYKAALES